MSNVSDGQANQTLKDSHTDESLPDDHVSKASSGDGQTPIVEPGESQLNRRVSTQRKRSPDFYRGISGRLFSDLPPAPTAFVQVYREARRNNWPLPTWKETLDLEGYLDRMRSAYHLPS